MLAEDQLGGAARNHMSWRIRRPGYNPRHHGRVSHAQACNTVYAELRIDHRETIYAHFAGADGMSEARRTKACELANVLGGCLRPGHDFDLAHTVEGALASNLTGSLYGAHHSRKIAIRAEIIAIDRGGILKIVARQTDGAPARWLH